MPLPRIERPDLPEYMTWEELGQLPEEIAGQIELWEGRVVWLRRGPAEHQEFTNLLWSGLRRCAREDMAADPQQCWRVHTETNIFKWSPKDSAAIDIEFPFGIHIPWTELEF